MNSLDTIRAKLQRLYSLAIFLGCIAVFFAAPHIGLNYTQMNLVMYLIVGIVSLAGEYSEYLHTILICAIS